jgi:predicted RNA binding protein YcfA (HicA-like mRNA interferase family)
MSSNDNAAMKKNYKVSEALEILYADGWYVDRIKGDHRQLRHPTKKGTVTVAGKSSITLPPKTLKSIQTQSELRF